MSFRGKHRLYLFVQNPGIFSNPFWSDESKVSFYFFHFIFHFFFAPLHFSFPILWILGRVTNQKLESIIFLLPFFFCISFSPLDFSFPILWILGRVMDQKLDRSPTLLQLLNPSSCFLQIGQTFNIFRWVVKVMSSFIYETLPKAQPTQGLSAFTVVTAFKLYHKMLYQ